MSASKSEAAEDIMMKLPFADERGERTVKWRDRWRPPKRQKRNMSKKLEALI